MGPEHIRRWLHTLLLGVLLLALLGAPAAGASATEKVPRSMASLGDSITRGFNSCGFFQDCTSRSWSTGANNRVDSHFERLRAIDSRMTTAHNRARSGARIAELPNQARQAMRDKAGYVTILMGANDACTSSENTMTSLEDFEAHVTATFNELTARGSAPLTFVSTIPDIHRLWEIGKDSSSARFAWSTFNICRSMLAAPLDDSPEAEARRQRVRERVQGYNAILMTACEAHDFCTHDGGAVFDYRFELSHVPPWDFFHPSTAGQNVLADLTWQHTFEWRSPGGGNGADG